MARLSQLLPELADWNDGRGISLHDWLATVIRSDHAVGYAQLIWPAFVEYNGYVFRDDFSVESLREWESKGLDRWQVEATLNTIHLDDLFFAGEEWSPLVESRAIHLGLVLTQTYSTKLARDFPDRPFRVEFWDGSGPNNDEISLSFWQQS